ncbi:O-methyltransferase [Stackebrandtia soli]|uniref:O-methyltransferase n=1 Tax=Stackebrandtia soli TaxID=1892856 RepID=UPI0039ECEE47
MSRHSIRLSDALHEYVVSHGTPPDAVLTELVDETYAALPQQAGMQIGPDQAAFTTLLVKLIGARSAVEVGTFTGMSSLAIARGLPADGKLICLDVSDEYTSIARRFWERDGQSDKIELRLGPALESLRAFPTEPHLDFAFIDADKPSYSVYWEELVPRMVPGGLIAVDNVLWGGRVVDPSESGGNVDAVRAFNDLAAADDRMEVVMLPVGDGLTLARKL